MRPAASAWEKDFSEKLEEFGLVKGVSAPTAFYCKEKELRCVVHGDDFTFLGWDDDLEDVVEHMKKYYELKVRGKMSGDPTDMQEITILNRRLTWRGDEMTYEADPKHAEIICEKFGLGPESKGLTRPCVKESGVDVHGKAPPGLAACHLEGEMLDGPLNAHETREFRAVAARANYLAQDRPDIQFAVKEVCREMSAPSEDSWVKLKRIARYLLMYPKFIWQFGGRDVDADELHVYADSDWAGCVKTRRSTSGGVAMLGGTALTHWSHTQVTVALSSGEAELVASVKAAAEGLGIRALARDLGWDFPLTIHTDSSAAKSIACRSGIGRVRHLSVRLLWMQEAGRDGRLQIVKVDGRMNVADLLTKSLSNEDIARHVMSLQGFLITRAVQS